MPGVEQVEARLLFAAPPPVLTPPVPLLNAATVPQFVNDITALDPLEYKYDAVGPNQYAVSAQPIQVDVGLGLNPATGLAYPKTNMFGYVDDNPASPLPSLAAAGVYYGKTFEVQRGAPIAVTWRDALPAQHVVPVDPTLLDPGMPGMPGMTYDPLTNSIAGGVPIVTHLHGKHTDAIYDGTPMQWWNAGGLTGMDYTNTQLFNPTQPANTFTYRNDQQAANLWYHDHAMGVTRLNAYAGMAGFYMIRDPVGLGPDTGLPDDPLTLVNENPLGLPVGKYEMGLAIQDKQFLSNGQLWFPANAQNVIDPATGLPVIDPATGLPKQVASTLPEMFGDVILVNGKAWPKMNVEARRYRFHLLNGSDSRFYTFSLDQITTQAITPRRSVTKTIPGVLPMWQIGTDDGLLNTAVAVPTLTLAPGERADVIVDFTGVLPGTRIVLSNSAPTPFPGGTKVAAGTADRVMAFDVVAATGTDTTTPPAALTGMNPSVVAPVNLPVTRQMALYETTDAWGRITPVLGTPASSYAFEDPLVNPADPNTALIPLNTQQVWQIYNNTVDTHPIHLHQVAYQVLTRGTFSSKLVNLGVSPTTGLTNWAMGPITKATAPVLTTGADAGWKDTIQIAPGEVITLRATFDVPGKYVVHCHILSHEEHDMMRYMQIGGTAFPTPAFVVDSTGAAVVPAAAAAPAAPLAVQLASAFSEQPIALTADAEQTPSLAEQLLA